MPSATDRALVERARSGEPAGLCEAGRRWHDVGGDLVSTQQAAAWMREAFDVGHRGAALFLAYTDLDLETWDHEPGLRYGMVAFGDGGPDDTISAPGVRSAAGLIAAELREAEGEAAGVWFRRALEGPPWDGGDAPGERPWMLVVQQFAFWSHEPGRREVCAAWCLRAIAEDDTTDQAQFRREPLPGYDPLRSLAFRRERWRHRMLAHLLDEHGLEGDTSELSALLSERRVFGRGGEASRVRLALERSGMPPIGSEASMSVGPWILAELLPSVVASAGSAHAVGLGRAASDLLAVGAAPEGLVMSSPFRDIEDEARRRCGTSERWRADSAPRRAAAARLLAGVGLGAAPRWSGGADPDDLTTSWRLLCRSPLLLGLWLGWGDAQPAQMQRWERFGVVFARGLSTAIELTESHEGSDAVIRSAAALVRDRLSGLLGMDARRWLMAGRL